MHAALVLKPCEGGRGGQQCGGLKRARVHCSHAFPSASKGSNGSSTNAQKRLDALTQSSLIEKYLSFPAVLRPLSKNIYICDSINVY